MKKSCIELRKETLATLKDAVGINFAVSYFVPVVINKALADVAFLYPLAATTEKTRPFAKVMFEHNTGNLIGYSNAFINDFMDSEKYPITTKINYALSSDISVVELNNLMKQVNSEYDEICRTVFKKDISEEEKEKIRGYKAAFYASVPEALMPYYEALSPEFFNRLSNI